VVNFRIVFRVKCINIWKFRSECQKMNHPGRRIISVYRYHRIYASTWFRPLISSAIYRASRMATMPTFAAHTWHQTEFCTSTCIARFFAKKGEQRTDRLFRSNYAYRIIECVAWIVAKMTRIFGKTTMRMTNDYYIFIARYSELHVNARESVRLISSVQMTGLLHL